MVLTKALIDLIDRWTNMSWNTRGEQVVLIRVTCFGDTLQMHQNGDHLTNTEKLQVFHIICRQYLVSFFTSCYLSKLHRHSKAAKQSFPSLWFIDKTKNVWTFRFTHNLSTILVMQISHVEQAKRLNIEAWDLVHEIQNCLQVTWMFFAYSLQA